MDTINFAKHQDQWNGVIKLVREYNAKGTANKMVVPVGTVTFIGNLYDPRSISWEQDGIKYECKRQATMDVWFDLPHHVMEAYIKFQCDNTFTITPVYEQSHKKLNLKVTADLIRYEFPLVSRLVAGYIAEYINS